MANKIFPVQDLDWRLTSVAWNVAKGLVVKLSSGSVVETSADTDLILGISRGTDWTKTTVEIVRSGAEIVIPDENITTDSTFETALAASKMVAVYFTGTTFTHSATDNTLVGYAFAKSDLGYSVRFLASAVVFAA